jgi:glutathione S-transferase
MITLFQFPRIWNVDNPSPFCMKIETYLRLAKIPYQIKVVQNPRSAPKKKLPFIKDEDGVIVPDSSFIVKHLVQKHGDKLDGHLSDIEKVRSSIVRKYIETTFQRAIIYQRWADDDFWPQTREAFFGKMPPVLMQLVSGMIRKQITRVVRAAGWYEFSKDEVYGIIAEDLEILSKYLEAKPYFMGDKPSSLDATAYAVLANCIIPPVRSRLQELAMSHKNLVDYVARMEQHLTSLA